MEALQGLERTPGAQALSEYNFRNVLQVREQYRVLLVLKPYHLHPLCLL